MSREQSGLTSAPFTHPWHARLFAITVLLNENGAFSWQRWTDHFSAVIAVKAKELATEDDYYRLWLASLEVLLAEQQIVDANQYKDFSLRLNERST